MFPGISRARSRIGPGSLATVSFPFTLPCGCAARNRLCRRSRPALWSERLKLEFYKFAGMSVSVRKGTTFSGQWGPPERLRRDPFDHAQGSSQLAGLARARSVAAGRSDRWTEAQAVSR